MVESLIREHFRNFQPYRSARSTIRSAKVFLDANELPWGNSSHYKHLSLNRYPDPFQKELRAHLARRHHVPPEMVFTGVGSDEIIDLIIRLFCDPAHDRVLVCDPTYGVYRVAAEVNAVDVVSCELNEDFQAEAQRIQELQSGAVKVIFLCSPNNPTGNLLRRRDIVDVCGNCECIVVVDEAYIDFAGPGKSVIGDVLGRENLIVLRTMSKAFGLAGIRLGYCIADPRVVEYLLKIKTPYNINSVTADLAVKALGKPASLKKNIERVVRQRSLLIQGLKRLDHVVEVYPSDANFLLVRFQNAEAVYSRLLKIGIVLRKRNDERLRGCLRITVGTAEENRLLMKELQRI